MKQPKIDLAKWKILYTGLCDSGEKAGILPDEIIFYLFDIMHELAIAGGMHCQILVVPKEEVAP